MRLVTFAPQPGAAWRTGVRTDAGIVDLLAVHAAAPVADWAPTPAAVRSAASTRCRPSRRSRRGVLRARGGA